MRAIAVPQLRHSALMVNARLPETAATWFRIGDRLRALVSNCGEAVNRMFTPNRIDRTFYKFSAI
jgi:hypothetical protein